MISSQLSRSDFTFKDESANQSSGDVFSSEASLTLFDRVHIPVDADSSVNLIFQLPDVVLIKDEDSDGGETFEEGEWKRSHKRHERKSQLNPTLV